MRAKYESLALTVLKDLAKSRGITGLSKMKKEDVIEAMLALDEEEKGEDNENNPKAQNAEKKCQSEKSENRVVSEKPENKSVQERKETVNRSQKRGPDAGESACEDSPSEKESAEDEKQCQGILEVMTDGFGFLRSANYLPGENDVYVSPLQIKRFRLKTGDIISGTTKRNNPNDKFGALIFIEKINGVDPATAYKRPNFEELTPIFPDKRLRLERAGGSVAMRVVDILSPIGKGQRGMIVSQPKAGKTTLLKQVAKSVKKANPDMYIIILLIDERPEEVTDMKEEVEGDNCEVIYSTFDELPEHHKRVSEMVIERAKRLVEHGKDVIILLDSITRLARAYNLTVQPSGRTLSGGLDPAALHMPKRFFGAARNMREGGSLTILATALVETGSKMDDVVFEEFKGTGNMELVLDRKLSEKRVFPAIDLARSSTRREDLLLTKEEQEAADIIRKGLNSMKRDEAAETVLNMISKTKTNEEFVHEIIKRRMI
ncbi:MAG: transcription termination factor Rho [Lachnospiraceae bacterium]|nr:transcription termination factor Rho [Lachnospiraceae bacterium]